MMLIVSVPSVYGNIAVMRNLASAPDGQYLFNNAYLTDPTAQLAMIAANPRFM